MSIVYFASDFVLIGILEIPLALTDPIHYAALLFPLAQVVSTVMTAERAAQFRRETTSEIARAERKAKREATRKTKRQAAFAATSGEMSNRASNAEKLTDSLTLARQSRKAKRDARVDTLLTYYFDNPEAGPTEAAGALNVSRQTIYTYQAELEEAGRLKKNGAGWEVT
jgi:DNA invertase Pin-like site-specific DNA recombinase